MTQVRYPQAVWRGGAVVKNRAQEGVWREETGAAEMASPGLVPAGVWSLRSHGVELAVRRKEAWGMQDSQAYNLQTEREQHQNLSLKKPGHGTWPERLPRDTAACRE